MNGSRRIGGIEALAPVRALRRWTRIAEAAPSLDPVSVKALRERAQALRLRLGSVLHCADKRLCLEARSLSPPAQSDWNWRPAPLREVPRSRTLVAPRSGTAIGDDLTLFHDCREANFALRLQGARGRPPSLIIDTFDLDGAFLSLAMDLPAGGVAGLGQHHILRVGLDATFERPIEVMARLNLRHGPNTERMVAGLDQRTETLAVEFDLAYSGIGDRQVDAAWIDLIFERPEMNGIVVDDLLLSRRIRAEI